MSVCNLAPHFSHRRAQLPGEISPTTACGSFQNIRRADLTHTDKICSSSSSCILSIPSNILKRADKQCQQLKRVIVSMMVVIPACMSAKARSSFIDYIQLCEVVNDRALHTSSYLLALTILATSLWSTKTKHRATTSTSP